jgi:hypothetical protein
MQLRDNEIVAFSGGIMDKKQQQPDLTIVVGGCNFVGSQKVIQVNALPEAIELVAEAIREIPPDSFDRIASSLEGLMMAIAELVANHNR